MLIFKYAARTYYSLFSDHQIDYHTPPMIAIIIL
jgi:hypothetical protein